MRLHIPLKSQFMYKRLKKIRRRAISVGFFGYFFGILILAVLGAFPMLKIDHLSLNPLVKFDKMFWDKLALHWDIDTISRILYLIMFVSVVIIIPVLACRRLGWLFSKTPVKRKKYHKTTAYAGGYGRNSANVRGQVSSNVHDIYSNKGYNYSNIKGRGTPANVPHGGQVNLAYDESDGVYTKTKLDLPYEMDRDQRRYHGFNRNVYAMKDLATLFTWSFALLIVTNVFLCMLNGTYAGTKLFDFSVLTAKLVTLNDIGAGMDLPLLAIVVGYGFTVTLINRILSRRVRLFTPEEGDGIKEKAVSESWLPLTLRTILQFIAIVAMPIFLLQINTVNVFVENLLQGKFSLDFGALAQLLFFFVWLALAYCPIIYCHRCIVTEYNLPEESTDHYYMLGVSVLALFASVGLFFAMDKLAFDFKSVTNLNIFIMVGVLFVIVILTRFLTKASVRYAEYDSVIQMITQEDEYEKINWKYAYSDNYVGGEEYVDGDEVGSIID